MAFRSELESARDRAEAAEAEVTRLARELASQRERIHRVSEVESQLEAARAAARVRGELPLGTQLLRMVVPLAIGVAGTGLLARAQMTAMEEAAAARDALHDREAASLEGELRRERFEAERTASLHEDELRESQRVADGDLQTLLPALATGGRLDLGVVEATEGDAPTSPGVRCHVESHPHDRCWASVVCGATIVHQLGCPNVLGSHLGELEPAHRMTLGGPGWTARIRLTHDPVPGPLGWE